MAYYRVKDAEMVEARTIQIWLQSLWARTVELAVWVIDRLLIGQTAFSEYQCLIIGKLAAITGHHFTQKESPPQGFLYRLFIFHDRPPFPDLAGDRGGQMIRSALQLMCYTYGEIPCWR